MQNQESNVKLWTEQERRERERRLQETAMDSVGELQSSRPETETSSCTANSTADSNPARDPASQSRNSEYTAVPKNPENEGDTVSKTVNLATFEDRIAMLESQIQTLSTLINSSANRLERLEDKLQTYTATSDKRLADRVRQLERDFDVMIQNQMGIPQVASTDLAAPSSNLSSQSAHCSEKLSTQNTDQACVKTSSRRDISWAEFDQVYTAILATLQAAAAHMPESLYATAWLKALRNRLESPTDTK